MLLEYSEGFSNDMKEFIDRFIKLEDPSYIICREMDSELEPEDLLASIKSVDLLLQGQVQR